MSIAHLPCVDKLVAIGLNKYEALAYLALLEKNNVAALDIAGRSGIPKQRIYDVLDNLQTKGLCSVREGRPRCYMAHRPQQALPAVLDYRKRQQALENERQAHLIEELIPALDVALYDENGELSSVTYDDVNGVTHRDIGGF